jgi:UDP-glucuronate 4-epimerase
LYDELLNRKIVILITGVAGFIGSHLAQSLLKNKSEVVGIDNFDEYYSPKIKKDNLKISLDYKNFTFKKCDIRNEYSLINLFKRYDIEVVYHLAARPGVRASFLEPNTYDEINVQGTLKLLQVCNKFKVKKFIFSSSSSVYGKNKVPFSEDDFPLRPLSFYGASKLNAEEVCKFFCRRFGFKAWIFRLFSIYGPRLRPDLVIYKFTKSILEGKEITLFNRGKYKRDFTFIDNIIDVFLSSKKNFPYEYEIVNLGNSQPVAITDLAKLIQQKLQKKAKIKYIKNPFIENPITFADTKKANKIFKFTSNFPLEKGLDIFLNWYISSQKDNNE